MMNTDVPAFRLYDVDHATWLADVEGTNFLDDYEEIDFDGYAAFLRRHNGVWEIGIEVEGAFYQHNSESYKNYCNSWGLACMARV